MSKFTIKTIVTLVSLLFLNIEAAQAGLVTGFRDFIHAGLDEGVLYYVVAGIAALGFVVYVVFTPVAIGNQKWAWYNYLTFNPYRDSYTRKRAVVKRIAATLGGRSAQDSGGI